MKVLDFGIQFIEETEVVTADSEINDKCINENCHPDFDEKEQN